MPNAAVNTIVVAFAVCISSVIVAAVMLNAAIGFVASMSLYEIAGILAIILAIFAGFGRLLGG